MFVTFLCDELFAFRQSFVAAVAPSPGAATVLRECLYKTTNRPIRRVCVCERAFKDVKPQTKITTNINDSRVTAELIA